MDIQQSLDLLDKIFLRARENAARAVGEDVLAGAEVFLSWAGGRWWVELSLRHHIAEKFNIWLGKTPQAGRRADDVYLEFCHEFARWCPPIDRGMQPSQPDARSRLHLPESVVWLGPLVSFDNPSKTQAARDIFKKPKAVELLLLGFTSTQLQVVDKSVHAEAMAAAFAKKLKIDDKLKALQEKLKKRVKAGDLNMAKAASFTTSMNSLVKEQEEVYKEADDVGRTLVPVVPFSAESLEELEIKFDLFF